MTPEAPQAGEAARAARPGGAGRPRGVAAALPLVASAVLAPGRAVVGGVRRLRGRRREVPVVDDEQVLPAAEVRGRRQGSRRVPPLRPDERPPRLRPRTIALVAVALAAPVGAAGVAVLTSERLALREVSVSGTDLLAGDDVRSAVGVPVGTPLAVVDLGQVADSVEALPEVADVEVERHWPSRLHVVVTERTAVTAVADDSGTFVLVDVTGTPFRMVPAPPADVPLLDVAEPRPGDPATVDGLTVLRALPPDLLAEVERVEVPAPGSVTLALRDGGRVVWGGPERSQSKAVVLQALLPQAADEYDVTAPEVAVTRS